MTPVQPVCARAGDGAALYQDGHTQILMSTEPNRILEEFQSHCQKLENRPKGKSTNKFVGQVFVHSLFKFLSKHKTKNEYTLVEGPLWIKEREWIEWDAALVKKGSKPIFDRYYQGDDIIALFELKASGIFGSKKRSEKRSGDKTLTQVVNALKKNFEDAKAICRNMKRGFYISLKEAKPKKSGSINYYSRTKRLEPDVVTCMLFDSSSVGPNRTPKGHPRLWRKLVNEYQQL